jgi:hypothetical protein
LENKIFTDNCSDQDLWFKTFTDDFEVDLNKDSLHDSVVNTLAEGMRVYGPLEEKTDFSMCDNTSEATWMLKQRTPRAESG